MASLGLSDHDTVVAYDDAGGVMAARLVWMLRVTGRAAALLNGGFAAYAGKPATVEPERPRGVFSLRQWPAERLATIDDAVAGDAVPIDARPPERFRGETEPLDPRGFSVRAAGQTACRVGLGGVEAFEPVLFMLAGLLVDPAVVRLPGRLLAAA
jgi:thiosulfate/3-mercaptopyruvate sulfurtransferase